VNALEVEISLSVLGDRVSSYGLYTTDLLLQVARKPSERCHPHKPCYLQLDPLVVMSPLFTMPSLRRTRSSAVD
jgi:hypothetical protein